MSSNSLKYKLIISTTDLHSFNVLNNNEAPFDVILFSIRLYKLGILSTFIIKYNLLYYFQFITNKFLNKITYLNNINFPFISILSNPLFNLFPSSGTIRILLSVIDVPLWMP